MTGGGFGTAAYRRLFASLGVVAVIVLAVPVADGIVRAVGADSPAETNATALKPPDALQGGGVEDVLTRIEQWAGAAVDATDVPPWFRDEVGFLPGARDARVNDDGCVVGYVLDGGAGEVADALQAHMGARGWTCVPLGGVDGVTCLKESGSCTWALVTCTGVGASTSVVTRRAPP